MSPPAQGTATHQKIFSASREVYETFVLTPPLEHTWPDDTIELIDCVEVRHTYATSPAGQSIAETTVRPIGQDNELGDIFASHILSGSLSSAYVLGLLGYTIA